MSVRFSKLRELIVFSMLGSLMLISKIVFEPLPNIHPLAALTVTYTLVYRKKALFPIYIYVFLQGLYSGFSMWWIPYMYIWTILWGFAMLIPKNISLKTGAVVYPLVCAAHGILFGTLYAPAQAIMFHLSFKAMIAWIGAGLYFDIIHACGNFVAGFLVIPLSQVLKRLKNANLKS